MPVDGPASTAQCFYCFEVLSSHFRGREPPELSKIASLYAEFEAEQRRDASASLDPPQVDRAQDKSPASTSTGGSGGDSSSLSGPVARSASQSPASLAFDDAAAYPLFVTWNTLSGRGKSLRGCIGTFEPLPLAQGLRQYTIVSALEDHRFNPIPASLIPSLACELTLLRDFEDCSDVMDWEIGKHGLRIKFVWKGRRMGATYLPHVCPEQGWDKEECIESLMCKAGWAPSSGRGGAKRWLPGSGRADTEESEAEKKPWETVSDMKVVRYQGAHADATHDQWEEWRGWAADRL